jgi:hypothetical protein
MMDTGSATLKIHMAPSSLVILASPLTPPDHTAIYSVVITQIVTLVIFGIGLWQARRSDREKRVKDAKKDVLLEVAPIIQKTLASLGELADPLTKVNDWTARLAATNGAIAKLTAVAGDETLAAARDLMTAIGTVSVKLMAKRAEVGTGLEATRQMMRYWHEQVTPISDLLATFSEKARQEIQLKLDKETFAEGIRTANDEMLKELENLVDTLENQQAGRVQGAQAGQTEGNLPDGPAQQLIPADHSVANASLTPEQIKALSQEVIQLRQRSMFWEYKFLTMFLVHRTQWVLDWLIDRQSQNLTTTLAYFDAELAARVIAPGERVAIPQALEAHLLVSRQDDLLHVTPKGLDFAHWRGPLQPPPAATA